MKNLLMTSFLIISTSLLTSNAFAQSGICMEQFRACGEELGGLCQNVKGESQGAAMVRQLCLIGSQQYCYGAVVQQFGQEECDKEYKEFQDEQAKKQEKKYETDTAPTTPDVTK